MPPTLTTEQIDDLRRDVDAGKRRKVFLLTDSAGLPAGGTGDVTRVGQPEVDGSDFIGVRIGGDDLFFSPGELGLGAGRGKAKAAAKAPATAPVGPTVSDAAAATAYAKATAERAAKAAPSKTAPAKTAAKAPAKAARDAASAPAGTAKAPAGTTAAASPPAAKRTAPAKAARGRKSPRLPAIALTIRSTDAGWTVEAQRGGKAALKATPVRAGTVQEIVDALDETVVTTMVREVLDARRAVAESEAAELREALARAEAVLAEYDAGA
ncbi:MAG TPA: hypothetical protein VGO94_05505 [Mycobacteriales bacterium]|nr:hypothetical protein [Mycobacteriales bacterium]